MGVAADSEPEILFVPSLHEETGALEWIKRKLKNTRTIITWHDFDLRFIKARALIRGVDIRCLNQLFFFDLCRWCQKNLALTRYSLNEVCKSLGIEKRTELNNKQMPELYLLAVQGNDAAKQKIIEHCKDDVEALRGVYKRVIANIRARG